MMVLMAACASQSGEGFLQGEIDAPLCWRGDFKLEPDYFGAAPFREQLTLRLQRGSESYAQSDGLSILVDDLGAERKRLGVPQLVGLAPELTPPNVPVRADVPIPGVHATLYLERTCKTENVALYALSEVRLGPGGECLGTADLSANERCAPAAQTAPRGKSSVTFRSLFNGDITASSDADKLNEGELDLYLADPRELCPNADAPPPPCRGHLKGGFKFLFERGKPAQAFP